MGGRKGALDASYTYSGDFYAESYKEKVNGVTVIRTRWIRKKNKKKKNK